LAFLLQEVNSRELFPLSILLFETLMQVVNIYYFFYEVKDYGE
jgi:hypothetical protein